MWWACKNLRAFLVEHKGAVDGSFEDSMDRKISVESCRLLRPLTSEELAVHGVFIGGIHKVGWGSVEANDTGTAVYATSRAILYADDGVEVQAYGEAEVNAYGNTHVFAFGNAVVHAFDSSRANAFGDTKVFAHDNSRVYRISTVMVEARPGHTGIIARL